MPPEPATTEPCIPLDSDYECPACGYNLSGLREPRCPECGQAFDPDELRRLGSPAVLPATPWDTRGGWKGFVQTWLLAAFHPDNLARSFPRRYDTRRAWMYTGSCYLIPAALMVLSTTLADQVIRLSDPALRRPPMAALALWLSAVGCGCAWLCEGTLGTVLGWLVKPTYTNESQDFWHGLVHYTGGFLVPTGLLGALEMVAKSLPGRDLRYGFGVAVVLHVVIFLWWCGALLTMIDARGRPGAGRVLAFFCVPLIGAWTVLLGACLFAAFAALMVR